MLTRRAAMDEQDQNTQDTLDLIRDLDPRTAADRLIACRLP